MTGEMGSPVRAKRHPQVQDQTVSRLGIGKMQLYCKPGPMTGAAKQPWVLVDPLFQDMEHSYRYYLSYCTSTLSSVTSTRRFTNLTVTTRLCQDLVSHDLPDNPFRSLIPLTMSQPLLQHVIVAASAAHLSNLISPPNPGFAEDNGQITFPPCTETSKLALQDALVAKHKALKLMHSALKNIDSIGGDVVLATALFFVNVELIESGKHGWKAHLEGAGRIMEIMQPETSLDTALRDYMVSDCLM